MAPSQQSVKVTRPQREVFVLGANPANDARWGSNLLEVSPGPLGVEGRFRYKARFAGRRFDGTRTFRAIPGGTRITFSGGSRAGGFLGLAEPLPAAQRSLRSDLASLRRPVEGRPQD